MSEQFKLSEPAAWNASSLEGYRKLALDGSSYFAKEVPVQGRLGVRSLLVLYPNLEFGMNGRAYGGLAA